MDLQEQATKLMAATDPTVWLTYDEYARDRIAAGAKAITVDQWDTLLSIAGGRQLQDTLVVSQITANVRTAAFGKANPMANGARSSRTVPPVVEHPNLKSKQEE